METTTYQQIIGEIGTLISIFAPLLTAYKIALSLGLNNYIETKINSIKDENLRKVASNTINRVENLASSTITMIEAVEKPKIIENIKNGKMTKDDLVGLKSQAIETIKKQLSTEGVTSLQGEVGDINTYLNTLVESRLADLKVDNSSSVSKTEISMPTQQEIDTVSLQNQLTQIQADKNSLTESNATLQSTVDSLTQDKNNLTSQNQSLNQQVSDLQTKLTQVQSALGLNTTNVIVDNSQVGNVVGDSLSSTGNINTINAQA